MSKTAVVFPGQGSQYVGMGKGFYENFPVARQVYDLAGKASGLDVAAICFEENEKINQTEYTQIAMLATEVAIWKVMETIHNITPAVTAGLSLGEYGALAVSQAMSLEDLFAIIRKRGIYMQEAVPTGGAMTAVLGLEAAVVEKICLETLGQVSVANYNCPGQIVITGAQEAVDQAAAALTTAGAKRCVPLKVSGPFHSPLLSGAGKQLGEALESMAVQQIQVPYLSNVTADYVKDAGEIKPLLVQQVSSSVRWQQSVERMIADGVTTFVEVGPGKTLTGFMRKINKEVTAINVETVEDLEKWKSL